MQAVISYSSRPGTSWNSKRSLLCPLAKLRDEITSIVNNGYTIDNIWYLPPPDDKIDKLIESIQSLVDAIQFLPGNALYHEAKLDFESHQNDNTKEL